MRGVETNCPACAGPVRFRLSTALVTVCEFCRTVVARTDRKIEDLGKVAAIVETASPLQIGLKGKYDGKRFVVMGRAQYRHAAGGLWDEWYVAFPNGRWGWLSEAQGRFHLTFEREVPEGVALPQADALVAGERVALGDEEFVVGEVGEAEAAGAEGEMPFVLHPGAAHAYADLHGTGRQFVTLDYEGTRPVVYAGGEVTLDDLGIPKDARAPEKDPARVGGLQINCPQCGGPLALRAPDASLRVVCPHCQAMLDADHGKLQYLQTLELGKAHVVLPIGSTGTLRDVQWTVIGFVRRTVTYSGKDYPWSEYLLYEPRAGFRWLIHSEGHWSFGEPASPGDVKVEARDAYVEGRRFRLFQQSPATVRYVLGEFYWKVELGETVFARDFVAPPQMLTVEDSTVLTRKKKRKKKGDASAPPPLPGAGTGPEDGGEGGAGTPTMTAEVNYTLSTYVPVEEIEAAFGVKDLRRGFGVAPNQPGPVDRRMYLWWAGFVAAIVLGYLGGPLVGQGTDLWTAFCAGLLVSLVPIGSFLHGRSFEVSRWSESDYSPYATSDDGDGDD